MWGLAPRLRQHAPMQRSVVFEVPHIEVPHMVEQIALPRAVVVDEGHRWGSWARLAHADASFRWLRPADSVPNMTEEGLAEQTLDTIHVERPRGRPKRRPAKLVADRGYDSRTFRRALRRRGIQMCIPPKRRPAKWRAKRGRPVVARKDEYRRRSTVERSFAWLGAFRRLLIRWERQCAIYHSFFAVALLLVCVRRLSKGRREEGQANRPCLSPT
jgi:transposase